jgi:RimJ/RimL family protein N-acetyltransferase
VLLAAPLETQDLLLRSLDVSAARGPYAAWMRDARVTRYLEARFSPPDEAALEAYIGRMNASADDLLLGLFLRAEPRRHIGNVKLGPVDRRHRSAPIGIAIGAMDLWGKGLASQAVSALADHAFEALGLERLEAGVYAPNEGSRRAFERAGFVLEGRRRGARLCEGVRTDELVMGRLRAQPPAPERDGR